MSNLLELEWKGSNSDVNQNIDMTALHFCIRAMDISQQNTGWGSIKYKRRLLIHDGYAIGSDGRSLHKAKLSVDYKNGRYRVFRKLKKHIILYREGNVGLGCDFPDYSNLFPKIPLKIRCVIDNTYKNNYEEQATIIRLLPENLSVNPKLLDRLYSVLYNVKYKGPGDPLIFEDIELDRVAAIMTTKHISGTT